MVEAGGARRCPGCRWRCCATGGSWAPRADAGGAGGAAPLPGDDLADAAAGLIAQVVAKVGGLGFLDAPDPAQLDRVHRPAGERRRPRVGPAQSGAMHFDDLELRPSEGRSLARRRGAAGAGRPRLLRVHADGGREDPARPGARLRRRARQGAAPDASRRVTAIPRWRCGCSSRSRWSRARCAMAGVRAQPEDKALVAADVALALTPAAVQVDHPIIDPLLDAIANRLRLVIWAARPPARRRCSRRCATASPKRRAS